MSTPHEDYDDFTTYVPEKTVDSRKMVTPFPASPPCATPYPHTVMKVLLSEHASENYNDAQQQQRSLLRPGSIYWYKWEDLSEQPEPFIAHLPGSIGLV